MSNLFLRSTIVIILIRISKFHLNYINSIFSEFNRYYITYKWARCWRYLGPVFMLAFDSVYVQGKNNRIFAKFTVNSCGLFKSKTFSISRARGKCKKTQTNILYWNYDTKKLFVLKFSTMYINSMKMVTLCLWRGVKMCKITPLLERDNNANFFLKKDRPF